jgi:hypothetical protein
MSNIELPPQKSPTDTSNWDNKVFTSPTVKSVDKVKKSVARREMILNAPERKRTKQLSLKERGIEKTK